VSDAPPDVVDAVGLSTRNNDGFPSLPELLLLPNESSLTRGRAGLGLISSKSVSFTCTVSASCNPSSSRNDFARRVDKEILERSEPLLLSGALGADVDGGVRESPWLEGSESVKGLRRSEPADRCRENGVSFPGAVRFGNTWLSLLEICIDGGATFSAGFDNECGIGIRLGAAASGFAEDCASVSCSRWDLREPARSDGSLFMGVSLRRSVGDVGELGSVTNVETLASKGDVLGLPTD
jgi:hypothetical protein